MWPFRFWKHDHHKLHQKMLFNVNKFGVVLIITNFKTVCVWCDMGVSLKLSCIHWTWMGSRPSSTIEVESRTVRLNIQGVFLPTKKKTKALWKLCICILHHLMEMPKNVWILDGGGGGGTIVGKRKYGEKPSEQLNTKTHTQNGVEPSIWHGWWSLVCFC